MKIRNIWLHSEGKRAAEIRIFRRGMKQGVGKRTSGLPEVPLKMFERRFAAPKVGRHGDGPILLNIAGGPFVPPDVLVPWPRRIVSKPGPWLTPVRVGKGA